MGVDEERLFLLLAMRNRFLLSFFVAFCPSYPQAKGFAPADVVGHLPRLNDLARVADVSSVGYAKSSPPSSGEGSLSPKNRAQGQPKAQ